MLNNNKLYPPIIEGALPAFYGDVITVSYTLNRGVGYEDIYGFSLIIKSTVTNEIIRVRQVYGKPSSAINFSLSKLRDEKYDLLAGGFYKIQLAFLDKNNNVGHYSNVGIAKYLGPKPPVLSIKTDSFNSVGCFTGTYTPSGVYEEDGVLKHDTKEGDITEKVYSYTFSLYDSNGQLIETSGEVLHNSTEDVGLVQRDNWFPRYGLDNGSVYRLVYSITTINNLKISTVAVVQPNKDEQGYVPNNLQLIADYSDENGVVTLMIKSNLPNDIRNLVYGKFQIFKTSSKDEYKSKERIAYFSLENQDIFEKVFKDFTVESGYKYRYVLQQINDYGIYSEEVHSNEVSVFYEHMYLFDGVRQLKIKFNPKVSTFKNTIFETKTDTIGSKYPFILRNPTVKYKEFNLSGLISYHMDEENLFLSDAEIWRLSNKNELMPDEFKTHNLTDESISAEKVFKNYVLDWLNNGEIKMLKTATEGVFLVRLMNVSLSPNDTVGRMLHTFTATAYEVQDFSSSLFSQSLIIDRTKKYIGYKTIPLYDFPKKTIIEKTNDNKWAIVYNKNAYEIINNTALEYVTGVRFEDIKPGTRFNIVLERDNRVVTFNLEIGATGTHRIDTNLGFHIRSIKLEKATWDSGDYQKDIINNKGQVTYEYERQANHNNFNDITKISADIIVSDMWCPTWYEAKIQEPLTTIDNQYLYRYGVIDDQAQGFIQVGYFRNAEGKDVIAKDKKRAFLINGIDYEEITKEGEVQYIFFGNDDTTIQIYPKDNQGCIYEPGQYIVSYEESKILKDNISNGVISTLDRFQWQPQVFNFENTNLESIPIFMQIYNQNTTMNEFHPDNCLFDSEPNSLKDYGATDIKEAALKNANVSFYKILNNNDNIKISTQTKDKINITTGAAKLFVQRYDAQGVVISSLVKTKTYRNPYYVKLEKWDKDHFETLSNTTKHKIKTVYSKEFFEEIAADNQVNYATDIIYKNFASNIYYNDTNVHDEYYMKEDIMNLYKIDFELIQVLYEEDLIKNGQNFAEKAYVQYENIFDDGSYAHTRQVLSSFQEAEDSIPVNEERRFATTHPGRVYVKYDKQSNEQSYIRKKITDGEKNFYVSLYDVLRSEKEKNKLQKLFNFDIAYNNNDFDYNFKEELNKLSYEETWIGVSNFLEILQHFPGDLFYKENVDSDYFLQSEAYWYQLLNPFTFDSTDLPDKILSKDGNTVDLNKIFVNVFIQATKNYTKDITPNDNEIIIVYNSDTKYLLDDEGNTIAKHSFFGETYPQRIDLSQRLSFTLEAPNYDTGMNNIVGIYLGKNVRAFATYKSKRYNYHALVGDGVYKDLKYID